ncbi:DNA replication terminus site-binding protein [Pseudomonas syringae]|uniref:DNA replication terminus site-binding protein n=1 Tax=Pseudomonas syringae TaxID=317 RepID=UPI001F2288BF|nr:DNA replication terminus site-binding protein [Pseudomonas syringae]MCF5371277.1 hypothetical protein [Pseudomonas syringae]MCF5382127.1 hypothetical protein [Pseudomonas syringae]MCF5423539.1 hypothetical protein [Pseudomonas syringae]MCF5455457.1 hypothetical protein [Pseudomonas syringae]MCF5458280.1 hypothetical protein [Pseudomonas syringae]
MAIYYSPQQGVRELVNRLEDRLDKLASQMRLHPDRLKVHAAYLVPFRHIGEVDDEKVVEVSALEGPEAIAQVIQGLTTIRIDRGVQNPRETLRVPGVVALPDIWIAEVKATNKIRIEIKGLVGLIDDKYERMQLWETINYLSALQTMRLTRVADSPEKVKFYWDAAPSVVKKKAGKWIAEFRKHLIKLHGYVPTLDELSQGDKSRKFVLGIDTLSTLNPNTLLAQFRIGQPHVRARITYIGSEKAIIRPAPTPIVYDIRDPVPLVTALTNWEPDEKPAGISKRTKINPAPFFEGLNLHEYLPGKMLGKQDR